ncbi:replicative DNA helicase [Bifidobacterium sp. SO1]|nr:replicative DNA helicase [Bifidobacterium sp. SO1]
MITSPTALDDAMRHLDVEDFYKPEHQIIYEEIVKLAADNQPVSSTILATRLQQQNKLGNLGGVDYLLKLVEAAPTSSNVSYFTDIVKQRATQRHIINVGMKITQMGYSSDVDIDSIITAALDEAFTIGEDDTHNDYRLAYDVAADMLKHIDDVQHGNVEKGVPTGFREIDDVTNGLQPGQMIVVAARPAMGKSTLGMDFARSAALHNNMTTIIFSLEMSGDELMQRVFSAETNIPLTAFRNPDAITPERWDTLNAQWEKLKNAPLYIDDSPNMKMADIRFKCKQLKKAHDLKLVVIDYLQLMSSGKSVENRQQEVSTFSRSIKMLAKELQVPVVVLSQLNRGVEMRADKVPQISDLRESGSIEQDADVIMLIHRPDAYDKEDRPGEADIILGKHRNGPTGTYTLAFLGQTSQFKDMPKDYAANMI